MIIKDIFFLVLISINALISYVISSLIYVFMGGICIEYIKVIFAIIFGPLTTFVALNVATTNVGFKIFCIIVVIFLLKKEIKFFGIENVLEGRIGRAIKFFERRIREIIVSFLEKC